MRYEMLDLLACPVCRENLSLEVIAENCGEIEAGQLRCRQCDSSYPIVRGIPRFVSDDAYAASFSYEWTVHARTQVDNERSQESAVTFTEKTGLTEADVKGKTVLEVGCGAGRFCDVVARWGGRVVGIDLSYAVESARANLLGYAIPGIAQADVFSLPFRDGVFDIVFSIGVLHHTPDARRAFLQLPRLVAPAGCLAVWVYSAHSSLSYKFSDLWRKATVRMPKRLLYTLCHVAVPLYWVYRVPLLGKVLKILLPFSPHPNWRWRILDTFDWYSPTYQSKHTYPEVAAWYREAGFQNIELRSYPVAVVGCKPEGIQRE